MSWDHKGVRSRYYRRLRRKGLEIRGIAVACIQTTFGPMTIFRDYLVPTHKKGRKPDAKFDKKDPARHW